jgi:general secretion pathway protein M
MNAQLARLRQWYAALAPREQRMVGVGSIALALLLLVGAVLLPLQSATSAARQRVERRREDLEWMQRNAPEIEAAGALPSNEDHDPPVVIVDRVGRESGLAEALRGTQPSPTGVRVQLEAAPFDTLITWIATLDVRHGLALESITVDRGAKPGTVNANVNFTAPKR